MRGRFLETVCALGIALAGAFAHAERIAVIGTGEVGSALGQSLTRAGHVITYGSRTPEREAVQALVRLTGRGASAVSPAEAAAASEIVVLAVPWYAVEDTTRSLGQLAGKIIIDPSNPRIEENGEAEYAFATGSNAERIQALAPGAHVVKAFSTLGAELMLDPAAAGGPVTVPIVGDDRTAKGRVAALIRGIGLEATDLGPLRHARIVEGYYLLRFYAGREGQPFNLYFRPVPGS